MKTALVIMLHGSPYASSNEPALRVAEDVRCRNVFDLVVVGYLECNEPPIFEAIRQCVDAAAERVIALPYFLHFGAHVATDLPEILDQAQKQWPHVELLMAPYLGQSSVVTGILAERAREAVSRQELA